MTRDKLSQYTKGKQMKKLRVATAFAMAMTATVVFAQGTPMVDGEVRKVDEAAGKITLKHGPIKSLDMDEPMTMVFRVKDLAMLKQVKVGDKVQFEAEKAPAGITITKMQKTK
jgi:Cu/Ag efflux protein CusF